MSDRPFYDPVLVVQWARTFMPGDAQISYDHVSKTYKLRRENADLGNRALEKVNRYKNPGRVLASVARRAIVTQVRR